MRIGIYGGSFNPIHNGHTALADSLIRQGFVDEMWLLVSPLNPLKSDISRCMADYEVRLEMARLATTGIKGVKVSDFENHLPIPSYMITTLGELRKTYPLHNFSLVIGADNWNDFGKWYKHEEIVRDYDIFIYRRPGINIVDEYSLPPRTKIVETPLFDISSTQIRDAIKQGTSISNMVAPEVEEYIRNQKLYV